MSGLPTDSSSIPEPASAAKKSAIWLEYVGLFPAFAAEDPPLESFGDSPEMADSLLDLVLRGIKRATAGLSGGEPEPQVGGHWLIADSSGVARAVVRTTAIRLGRLDSVDETFARREGEGDLTAEWWLGAHRGFFQRTARSVMTTAELDSLEVSFEEFELVWPRLSGSDPVRP